MKQIMLTASLALSFTLLPGARLSAQEEGDNPLIDIATDMTVVVRDLSKLSTGKPTQETQKLIVGKLDELIARLEKECADCRGGASGANPTKPLADSVVIGGPGGIGDLHSVRNSAKKWGELPPHQRDRILQSQTEGFPAHYQKILERYYKRLAEEKPATETDGGDKPDSKPQPSAARPTANGAEK